MHEKEGLETYQVRKNLIKLEETLRKRFKVRERERFWEVKRLDRLREIKRNEFKFVSAPYIALQ